MIALVAYTQTLLSTFLRRANVQVSSDGGCRKQGLSSTGWVVRAVGPGEDEVLRVVRLAVGGTPFHRNLNSFTIELFAIDEVTAFLDKFM